MPLVKIPGDGFWVPAMPNLNITTVNSVSGLLLLDANTEEAQLIGPLTIDGGGTKTFGLTSSIGWTSTAATFGLNATLRVGLKGPAQIDPDNGPPARAILGAAAFDVYRDLVGGTDTITGATWNTTSMTAGTPLSLTQGQIVAVSFLLTTTGGTPSLTIGQQAAAATGLPTTTLAIAGPTYTTQTLNPNVILTFNDGTLGWLPFSHIMISGESATGNLGTSNCAANVVTLPFECQIDALAARLSVVNASSNFTWEVLTTPLGTPAVAKSVTQDGNIVAANAAFRMLVGLFDTPCLLSAGVAYAIGVRQLTANGIQIAQRDVADAAYFKPSMLGAECYAGLSTAGAAFVPQNSGRRRYSLYMRVSHVHSGEVTEVAIRGQGVQTGGRL